MCVSYYKDFTKIKCLLYVLFHGARKKAGWLKYNKNKNNQNKRNVRDPPAPLMRISKMQKQQ